MTRAAAVFVAVLASAFNARAETVFVNDPLTGPPQGAVTGVGVGSRGGSHGSAGWTTTGRDDTIWYSLPTPIPTGRVEVTLTGAGNNTTLDGDEMDILALYGITDQAEPIAYVPYHRSNDFKAQVRIFGRIAGSPPGSMSGSSKFELRICNAGPPGWHETCPAGCVDQYFFPYLGCAWCPLTWDPSTAYRIVVQWGVDASGGWMTYTRGVEPAVRAGFPGTYAPTSLRVRIGSPRNDTGSSTMPVGVTFRDILVAGDPGPAMYSCIPGPDAGPPPDAGPGDAGPPDAGPLDAGARDAGVSDAGAPDAGEKDAGARDANEQDAGVSPDAGLRDVAGSCGCEASAPFTVALGLLLLAFAHRRPRRRMAFPASPNRDTASTASSSV